MDNFSASDYNKNVKGKKISEMVTKKNYLKCSRRLFSSMIIILLGINLSLSAEIYLKGMGGWTRSTTNIWHLRPINNFVSGIGVEFWPIEYIGFELDTIVVNKGHADPPNSPYYDEKDGTFTQICIPFMLKLRMKLGSFRIGAFEGIAISPIIEEMDSNFGKLDYNIIVGGFIEKCFSNLAVFIDVRYDWGLNYLSIEYIPSRTSFKTRTLYVMGGIKFGL